MTRDFMKAPPSVVNPRHPTEKIALHHGGKKKILKRCKNNTKCEPDYKRCSRPITNSTHGAAKMTGGRSPLQLYFSLSWQDLSSTAAALTFRSLCIGALRVAPVRRKPRVGQAVVWRRSSFASFDIGLGSGR